jgi:hypothetical protein
MKKHEVRFFKKDDYQATVDGNGLYIDSAGDITERFCESDGGLVVLDRFDLDWEDRGRSECGCGQRWCPECG